MTGKIFKLLLSILFIATASIGAVAEAGKGGPTPPLMRYAQESNGSIILYYDLDLDTASVPAASDFVVTVSGQDIPVISVTVNSVRNVILTLASDPTLLDTVIVDYTPGTNPIQNLAGDDSVALVDAPVTVRDCGNFDVQTAPTQIVGVGNKIYVFSNDPSGYISILDKSNNNQLISMIAGLPTVATPIIVGTDIYIFGQTQNKVLILDTLTDTITEIPMGEEPIFGELVGTKLYVVLRATAGFSVIDTNTKSIVTTVAGADWPRAGAKVGSRLYLSGTYGSLDYIDLNTDTITHVYTNSGGFGDIVALGTKLYIVSSAANELIIFDSVTNTVASTVSYGTTFGYLPFPDSMVVGTDIYFTDAENNEVVIFDTTTETFTGTVAVGMQPTKMVRIGSDIYVMNTHDSVVSVISTNTKTLTHTIASGTTPHTAYGTGSDVYISNSGQHSVSVFDATTKSRVVCYECVYTADAGGAISGTARQLLRIGQDPTSVTATPNPGYAFSKWTDAVLSPVRADTGLSTTLVTNAEFRAIPVVVRHSAQVIGGNAFTGSLAQAGSTDLPKEDSKDNTTWKTTQTLKMGDRNESVKLLQQYLNTHGYVIASAGPGSTGYETTYFGPKTKVAVISFQKASGLTPDGVVGPKTQAKIK